MCDIVRAFYVCSNKAKSSTSWVTSRTGLVSAMHCASYIYMESQSRQMMARNLQDQATHRPNSFLILAPKQGGKWSQTSNCFGRSLRRHCWWSASENRLESSVFWTHTTARVRKPCPQFDEHRPHDSVLQLQHNCNTIKWISTISVVCYFHFKQQTFLLKSLLKKEKIIQKGVKNCLQPLTCHYHKHVHCKASFHLKPVLRIDRNTNQPPNNGLHDK